MSENESSFSSTAGETRQAKATHGPKAGVRSTAAARSKATPAKTSAKLTKSKTRTPDKRERILKAAERVFARKGFYAAKVSEIAKTARIADGTIYLYFKNKDAILISLFEDRLGALVEVLRAEVQSDRPFEDRFRRVIELQLGVLDGQRDLAEVLTINLRQSSRLLKQYAAPLFTQYLEVFQTLIAEAQEAGIVSADIHPRLVARAVWGALDGTSLTWAIGNGEPGHLVRAARELGDLFLSGLTVRKQPT